MALGRISGPMLKADLERNGVDLSIDGNLLYVDVANNRIGINTATPTSSLDVTGDIKVSSLTSGRIPYASTSGLITDSTALAFDGNVITVNTVTYGLSGSNLTMGIGGTEVVSITPTGVMTVGASQATLNIGTPTLVTGNTQLQLGAGRLGDGSATIDMVTDTTYTDYGFRFTRAAGLDGATQLIHRGLGILRIRTLEESTIRFETNSVTSRMVIMGNGNVGIGTTNAQTGLDIQVTSAIRIPTGTTAQRPTGAVGYVRYNTDLAEIEYHNGTDWFGIPPITVSSTAPSSPAVNDLWVEI